MGTLYNVDNSGNQTVGIIGDRTILNIQQNVLPYTTLINPGSFTAAINTEYNIEGVVGTITLPSGAPVGSRIRIASSQNPYIIACPSANYIIILNHITALGGNISAVENNNYIDLVAYVNIGQVGWLARSFSGNWLIDGTNYTNPINNELNSLKVTTNINNGGAALFDVANNVLNDNSGVKNIDVANRKLYDTSGTHVQIDYSTPNVIEMSPLGSPLQNTTNMYTVSIKGTPGMAGTVTLAGSPVNVTAYGASPGDIVLASHANQTNTGVLRASVTASDTVTISSTVGTDTAVNYWVVKTH